MASKMICSVPTEWTMDDYSAHNCSDGSHFHFSFAEISEQEKKNVVRWLRRGATRREKSIVQIFALPKPNHSWAGRQRVSRLMTPPLNLGLSFRIGEYHAKAVRKGESWAVVMLLHMKNRAAHEQSAATCEG